MSVSTCNCGVSTMSPKDWIGVPDGPIMHAANCPLGGFAASSFDTMDDPYRTSNVPKEERMVLVGRRYHMLQTSWNEWEKKSFDEVCSEMSGRRLAEKANSAPDEIIEVIVVRRARIAADITVTEVPVHVDLSQESEGDRDG